MEDSEEENQPEPDFSALESNFLLRNYQAKMVDIAKSRNSIVFLPTGSGKTLIAVHVLCSLANDIKGSLAEGAKRVFFLNTTKVMVYQVGKVLKTLTKFKVGCYTGDMGIDSWSKSTWLAELERNHVIVVTGEILRQMLDLKFISISNIRFLVIDECHHALSNHPYKAIMDMFERISPLEAPLVLGLSAVLLKSISLPEKVKESIETLEKNLRGKVITHEDSGEVLRFTANPKEEVVFYDDSLTFPFYYDAVLQIYTTAKNFLCKVYLKSLDTVDVPVGAHEFKNKNKAKRIKNCFVLAEKYLQTLGTFCGSLAALFYTVAFEKFSLLSRDKDEVLMLMYARSEMTKARHLLVKAMGEEETFSVIHKFSSHKVQKLIDAIRNNNGRKILIFVHERSEAIILSHMFKILANSEGFSWVKADFIVGTSVFSSESIFNTTDNQEIIKRFSCGDVNVLVATNLLEEGVDISVCDVVISFDFPLGYPSYFQSKGRARHRESIYYMFIANSERNKTEAKLKTYKEIYQKIKELVTGESNDEDDSTSSPGESVEKIGIHRKSGYIEINAISAIKIVYRYTQMLPQDKFSFLTPAIWYQKYSDDLKQAFLQLPMVSPLREVVEGDLKKSIKHAKRSVFLKTAKLLYDMGELDENFNAIKFETKGLNFDSLFPHYKKEKIDKSFPQPGTKKRIQIYRSKFADHLSHCLPYPGTLTYLHVIRFNVASEKPEIKHRVTAYDLLRSSATYGILSTKKLPKVCQFPLFLRLGQVDCELLENYDEFYFNESELEDIKVFHFSLFKKVLRISKSAQVFDCRNKELSYFVVPVDLDENLKYSLNWDIIRCDYCKNVDSALVRYNPSYNNKLKRKLSERSLENRGKSIANSNSVQLYLPDQIIPDDLELNEEKPKFTFTETDYKYFVFTPSYRRMDPPQFYALWKTCHDMTPFSSVFPNNQFDSYCTYYKAKYDLEITNPNQPLLKVSPLFKCACFNHPLQKIRKPREKLKEHEEHFIPEFCEIVPFVNKYWVKANLLPTALNRIAQVYNVEEFRRYIAQDSGLGSVNLPKNSSWKKLCPDESCFEEETEEDEAFPCLDNFESSLPLSKLKKKTWNQETKSVVDPDRILYKVGVVDLEYFVKRLGGTDLDEVKRDCKLLENNEEVLNLISRKKREVPSLKILNCCQNELGPELTEIIRASTAKSANDLINYERLEILGDSFLKFAVSLFLFRFCDENEGVLTFLKGKLVGNRNLLYCGLAKNFQNIVNVSDFDPLSDWNPPLLNIPENLSELIVSNKTDPAVIYQLEIPREEQFSGKLSEETLEKNARIIESFDKACDTSTSLLLPYKAVKDKIISDCVEAFIGAYLKVLGLPGAFDFLSWMDILPKTENYDKLIKQLYKIDDLDPGTSENVLSLLSKVFYADLEETLGYTFKNKTLLLEALSHPSFMANRITNCYQRLEFLGDAVLDFLITTYIYENFPNLNPGQVTDIRSALVNNVTFGCLTVRYELHKYMLLFNASLSKMIENFVSFQLKRNHLVNENVLVLLEEKDCLLAESVQIPKALGDIFESLAGAIFLDSGNSLETVWEVYYRMMYKEIESFTDRVPKNSIRLLTEICNEPPYYEIKVMENKVKAACTIYYNDYEIATHGYGDNKKEAKLSAAKLAIKTIMESKMFQ